MKGLSKNASPAGPVRNYKYYIGIDCGVQTGLCVWSKEDKAIKHLVTVKIHVAMNIVKTWNNNYPGSLVVRVEDARQVRYGTDPHRLQGAGSVKRDAVIWEDYLKDLGIEFVMLRPKKALTKLDANTFKSITKYAGTTSSHARDAAMLVFGS